ncbi:MAG: hypothetical protein LBI58_02945 [Tannerellaceae bacterium]|jgi:hypothetical protein|nr:hypothetical protein [Tannerellaceae bacterium]
MSITTKTTRLTAAAICAFLLVISQQALDAQVSVQITNNVGNAELRTEMETNASLLLSAFNRAVTENKKPKLPDKSLTPEAKKKVEAIWKTSKMSCIAADVRTISRTASSGEQQIRNIPMLILEAGADGRNENIAFNFDERGMISDVVISLKTDVEVIVAQTVKNEKTPSEDVASINKILDFVEKFRTAYNCKDINFLQNIYSDNALIINVVKKSVRQVSNTDQMLKGIKIDDKGYDFQVKTKQRYLADLDKVFKKNAFVNIAFDSIDVKIHPGISKLYGVTLYQTWRSSTYNDKGFLYLMIDCHKEYEMQIFVRAFSEDKIFDFGSFSDIRRFSDNFNN